MYLNMQNNVRLFAHVAGKKFEIKAICLHEDTANAIMDKDPTIAVLSVNNGLIFLAEIEETK